MSNHKHKQSRSDNLIGNIVRPIADFSQFTFYYCKKKIVLTSQGFERNKNHLVKFFLMKRGRYSRPFLHLTTMVVLGIGVLVAPYLADTYPIFSSRASTALDLTIGADQQSVIIGEDVFETKRSEKPRDKILTYAVQKGDTLSTIATKFDISTDTIKWENNLVSDNLTVGDELKILPVTGVAHKVQQGDTVYTIAKRYDTEAQNIADFPFNEFANPETFSLVVGQMLIVPDGIKPSERPSAPRRQVYIAQGPTTLSSSGFTWPIQGGISQFASWYHMALDITSSVGVPIVAGQSGKVSKVSVGSWDGGYGNNVYINDEGGFGTHYAHMQAVNVSVGQDVVAGRTVIGWVGLTGRTTGPHLHFEISRSGSLVNPLLYLR